MLTIENELVPGAFTASRLTALELLASQAAISLENARLLRRNQEARRESQFLADASELLAESLDYEDTLSRLARIGVPFLADRCVVDVVEDGRIRRVGVDPAQQTPEPMSARRAAAVAVRTGRTCVLSDLTDGEAHSVAVPLVARGSTLGVVTFVVSRPGVGDDPERTALAEELGRRATVALENARLYCEAQASIRARDEFLSTASHELRSPLTSLLLTVQGLRRGKLPLSPETLLRVSGLLERQATRLGRLVDHHTRRRPPAGARDRGVRL